MADEAGVTLTYGRLKAAHPEYLLSYWRRLEAFYAGGRKLLQDAELMAEVFPSHTAEDPDVYLERKRRAFYLNHAGSILDHLCSAMRSDPVHVRPKGAESTDDPFYKAFFDDCSPPHGRRLPFNRMLSERMLTALIFRRAWTLVDLPDAEPGEYASLADQLDRGALDAYACPLQPYEVLDWEEDDDGELIWMMRCQRSQRRMDPMKKREEQECVETYTLYTRVDWTRFEVRYKAQAAGGSGPPTDDQPVVGETRPHSFGRVPVARMELPEGLWAMDRLESPVREHFNKSCAAAWFEYKCAYPLLYEFNGTESPGIDTVIAEAQQDPYRSTNQRRGIGYVQVRGKDDSASYVGPEPGVLEFLSESTRGLKDEVYRILFAMALASDNSAAALGRSADSKAQDKAATSILLVALGEYLRDHAIDIHDLVSAGRKEATEWDASGADTFDPIALTDLVNQTVVLEGISIPSATFQRIWKGGLAKRLVAADADEDDLRTIDEELKGAITQDQLEQPMPALGRPGRQEDGDDEEEGEPPPRRPAAAA